MSTGEQEQNSASIVEEETVNHQQRNILIKIKN
jgi:hypothetical protein